jgi:outer membrane lipoprotein-sorting protein
MWMKIGLAAAVTLAATTAAWSGGMEALEELGTALRRAPAWHCDYRQEYISAGMSAGEVIDGEVLAAWPDRALFQSGDPATQLMGLDGRVVRLVDLSVPSCDEHLLDDDEWARIPLAAILDPRSALNHFSVLESGNHGFALVPREPGGVARVEVVLNEANLPQEVVVIDPQGATNRLEFTNWRRVDGPPGGSWLPDAPPGLDCVVDNP